MMAVKSEAVFVQCFIFQKLLFFTCFLIAIAASAKLNVPRILLPYNTGVPTNYTLEVKEGGCYKWSSSRYDLVSVTPLPSEKEKSSCTTKAIVSAISRYPERESAIVRAEDEKTGQVLRCDVLIDSIHSIEIVTTTRVLFLEDAPEVFEVLAKNDQSDTFSSLEGVPFQWSLDSDALPKNDAYGVLRFLKFADSFYKTPPSIEFWERQNLHGSLILMEGSKTGSAKVTVRPLEDVYKHVNSYEVRLVIVANLNLKPSYAYLLPGTELKFQVELIKQGKAYPVSLPSEQYYLEVTNKTVASLKPSMSSVIAHNLGSTNLVVRDRYIVSQEIVYLPSAAIHVTTPSYMTFSVVPGDKWSLEEKKTYFISINLFDRSGHPIRITESVSVLVKFPTKFFTVKQSSNNGTYHEVYTLVPGSCQIKGELLGVKDVQGSLIKLNAQISASQDVTIYESIKVLPTFTLLPWDPVAKPRYSLNLKATGGTGSYTWVSNDTTTATVDQIFDTDEPKAKVTAFGLGPVKIVATDAHISLFSGSAEVSLKPVLGMKILQSEVEIEMTGGLNLPLALYGHQEGVTNDLGMFSDCNQVPVSVDVADVTKFVYMPDVHNASSTLASSACRSLHLKCLSLGHTRILVKYERNGLLLKDTAIVACYKPLKPIYPINVALVAVGSTLDVAFDGGPRPWPLASKGYYIKASTQKSTLDVYDVRDISDVTDYHVFWVLCKNLGDSTLHLEVGNVPSEMNPKPAKNQASMKLVCAVPDVIVIRPILLHRSSGKKCPTSDDERVSVHSHQDLPLELVIKDSSGRKFANVSSLEIKWHLSDHNLGILKNYEGVETMFDRSSGFKKIDKNYQEFIPKGLEGNVKVTASIQRFKPDVFKYHGINLNPELQTPLHHTLNLHLVEDAEIVPKKISIFNNPSNKVYLNISKGSGHFLIETSDPNKADVVYKKSTRQIEVVPYDTGSFTITLHDLCLDTRHEAVAHVQIYGISAILVDVIDKVELGKHVTAAVEVLNEDKQKIPASLFSLMNLQPVQEQNILTVKLQSNPEPHHLQALYTVTGTSLGHTSLQFVSTASAFKGVKHSSEILPLQVFPPLRVIPDNITLVVGAKFQVLYSGGPLPQSNIEYAVEEEDIAAVSTAGIIAASKLGRTTLVARSVGQDKKGHRVIFSQDVVSIYVISLHGIKIHTPLNRMQAGTEMPACAMGLNDQETPFAFGTAFPELRFRWKVNNEKVVAVHGIYKNTGIQEDGKNNFCMRIKAQQGGHVTLHLEVTLPSDSSLSYFSSPQTYTDEVQLQVFEKLKLTNPEVDDGMLLLSPSSHLKLKCNRLGPAKVSYSIKLPDGENTQQPVASVNEQGILTSHSKTGAALLVVTAVEEFGVVQRITVLVKVEEIAYIMVQPDVAVKTTDWPLLSIPVGFTVPLSVSYHDNIGEVFDAVRSQLNFRPSRFDLAKISFGTKNGTLNVQVLKTGVTVLKVWDLESSVPTDYIRIVSGPAIDPSDVELTVGDVVCFGSPLLTQEGHRGTWTSESSILNIHPASGGAVALMPGSTTVTYSLSDGLSTAAQIRIHSANSISIVPGNLHYISNVPRSKPFHIPVVIQSNGTQRINNIIGRNCSVATQKSLPLPVFKTPFVCELVLVNANSEIAASDIFFTSSGFDVEKGMYYCSIEALSTAPLKEIAILEAQVSLSVHLLSQDHSSSLLSQPLRLSLLPAFVVHQDEIVFSNVQFKASLSISATPAVQQCILVGPSDPTVLEVLSPQTDSKHPSYITFPVRLRIGTNFWRGDLTPLYLDVSCPITKQQIKIPVKIKLLDVQADGTQCIPLGYSSLGWKTVASHFWENYQSLMLSLLSIAVTIIGLILGCRALLMPKQGTVTNQPGVFLGRPALSDTPYNYSPMLPPRSALEAAPDGLAVGTFIPRHGLGGGRQQQCLLPQATANVQSSSAQGKKTLPQLQSMSSILEPSSFFGSGPPHGGIRRFSPPESLYEQNLSQQTRLWSLDDSPQLMYRRRTPNSGSPLS